MKALLTLLGIGIGIMLVAALFVLWLTSCPPFGYTDEEWEKMEKELKGEENKKQ